MYNHPSRNRIFDKEQLHVAIAIRYLVPILFNLEDPNAEVNQFFNHMISGL